MIQLRDYQQQFVSDIYAAWKTNRVVAGVMPTAGGKCLGRDTPVLLRDGSVVPVQDVQVGDKLVGPDGGERRVTSICSGREALYRVTPTKGDPYVVNESHILSFRISGKDAVRDAAGVRHVPGAVANVDVRTYLASSKTFKHVAKGWRAPAVEFEKAQGEVPLPPYILGVWLGGGTARLPSITSVDAEVIRAWEGYAESIGHYVRREDITWFISSPKSAMRGRGYKTNAALNALRALNLVNNKHIPPQYLTASVNDRKELLAGIVDTDGYLSNGSYDLVFKQQQLAEDVVFLARSLGLAAYVRPCKKTCTNTGYTGTYWRINISGDTNLVPCRVERRKAAPRRQPKSVLRHGVTAEPIGEGDYYGFEIEGPDRLFLLGDFTVTHNTVCFSSVIHDHNGAAAAIVHRKELLGQISMALAALDTKHRVVAPPDVVTRIRRKHLKKYGKSFVDPNAAVGVVSAQTVTSKSSQRNATLQRWLKQVRLAVADEFHHYTNSGQWGRVIEYFNDARILGVTACPERADGKGLGAHADGFAEALVEGPTVSWLIKQGYLSTYRYLAPDSDLDVSDIPVTASGDLNTKAMRKRVVKSHLVGDVVTHYQKYARGKQAIVFATDVETAGEIAESFRRADVNAEAVSGETERGARDAAIDAFEDRRLQVLVNVDLFDEGFDVPGVDAVILARPTESLGKYLQMVGRVLRVVYASGYDLSTPEGRLAAIAAGPKPHAIIIDPVRNWERHGMPDWPRSWTLDGREPGRSRRTSDTIPQRVCTTCTQPYERFYVACPYCGAVPEPAGRSRPEQVDGDLRELDTAAMEALWAEMRKADMPDDEYERDQIARGIPRIGRGADMKRHRAAKYRRQVLRELVGWWVGMQEGRDMPEIHRRFYHRFGTDIATAFTLKARETDDLIARIEQRFSEDIRHDIR